MSSEVSAEIIAKTRKSLGKYVKKPALTEKLLKKPPFRFLHDVVKAVINETGFLKGLFTDDELNSDNVKEKEAKVAFLKKLIDAVTTLSKTELKARPSKIVAGLECTETNILLQTIAKCIDRKVDAKDYVAKANSGQSLQSDKRKSEKKRDTSVSRLKKTGSVETPKIKTKGSNASRLKKVDSEDTPKSTDRARSKQPKEDTSNKHKPDGNKVIENNNLKEPEPLSGDVPSPSNVIEPEPALQQNKTIPILSNARQGSAGLVRPKSARPKSGDRIRQDKLDEQQEPVTVSTNHQRPKSSLRPPSVRPSSARPGAPRLRPDSALPISEPVVMGNINVIVENFDSGLGDDEETVVIQNAPEATDEDPADLLISVSGDNQGQLVEQILEQIQEEEGSVRKKVVEIDWEHDGLRDKDATTKEVTQLRSLIQSLTKVANPLGKLMNYLHEDLDAMHNELQTWTNSKKQLYVEIEKEKKLARDSSKPLLDKLNHLKQEIKKQEQEISTARGNILRNDLRIKELSGNK